MTLHLYIGIIAATLASCGPQRQPQQPTRNSAAPVLPAPSAPPAVANTQAPPKAAPKQPTVDPKSTEAATELVRNFAELLNQRKFDEAYMLLGPGAPPRAQFDKQFSRYADLHVSLGAAGQQEGAAGSIYLSVPLTVSGSAGGTQANRSATAILRRVNDVPGSTDAQRHWHIERIDWPEGQKLFSSSLSLFASSLVTGAPVALVGSAALAELLPSCGCEPTKS